MSSSRGLGYSRSFPQYQNSNGRLISRSPSRRRSRCCCKAKPNLSICVHLNVKGRRHRSRKSSPGSYIGLKKIHVRCHSPRYSPYHQSCSHNSCERDRHRHRHRHYRSSSIYTSRSNSPPVRSSRRHSHSEPWRARSRHRKSYSPSISPLLRSSRRHSRRDRGRAKSCHRKSYSPSISPPVRSSRRHSRRDPGRARSLFHRKSYSPSISPGPRRFISHSPPYYVSPSPTWSGGGYSSLGSFRRSPSFSPRFSSSDSSRRYSRSIGGNTCSKSVSRSATPNFASSSP